MTHEDVLVGDTLLFDRKIAEIREIVVLTHGYLLVYTANGGLWDIEPPLWRWK